MLIGPSPPMPDPGRSFVCPEFDGCTLSHCAYEGEEECHWQNLPVEGCECLECYYYRLGQAGVTVA